MTQGWNRRERAQIGGTVKFWAASVVLALLALAVIPAHGAGPTRAGAALGNPHLASMQVEIWPEYDRPAALVIMRGALAADTELPADIALRIPKSSGGPSAMAFSAAAGGDLLNLEYKASEVDDYLVLRFKATQRYFHVEYYDPFPVTPGQRNYTYTWPGDFSANQLGVVVQQPATASDFVLTPNAGRSSTGQDGLRYHMLDLGAPQAGKRLPVKLSYTKSDARTSSELLAASKPAAASSPAPREDTDSNASRNVLIVVLVGSLLVAGITAFMWWRARGKVAPVHAKAQCPKCGAARAADDRYCSKCGAALSA